MCWGAIVLKNLRWYMAGLLMLATTICYLDRQALTIASVVIKDLYHLTPKDYANIVMAYTLAYGFMQPFAGRLIDWMSTRRGLAASVFTWSIASAAHVLGRGVLSFSILRAVLGITEAGNFPGAAKAVSEWFPPKERATATGIYNCGAGLGAIIAPLLMGVWLIPHYGWQIAFVVTSSLGLLWVWAWLRLYYLPAQHPLITPKELAYIEGGQEKNRKKSNVRSQRVAGSAVTTRVLGAGYRARALRPGLDVLSLLDSDLPECRARLGYYQDRIVCLDAVFDRGSWQHGRWNALQLLCEERLLGYYGAQDRDVLLRFGDAGRAARGASG